MTALFALMMSLVLTACSSAPVTNVRAAPLPAPLSEPELSAPHFEVTMDSFEDSAQAEDGTPLASYRFVLPVLHVLREDGSEVETAATQQEEHALNAAETFNRRFGEWAAAREFNGLVQEAQADLDWKREEGLPWYDGYALELDCQVYQTDTLISILGTYYSNTGGAHPNTWQLSWNFDLTQGAFFDPEFLAEGTDLGQAVTAEIIRQANEPGEDGQIPAEFYWEDYQSIAANWGSYAAYFNEEGMTVIFSPYELAAYAAGPQEFRMPYAWLAPHLGEHGRELLSLESGEP